jgi:hypothetical protein
VFSAPVFALRRNCPFAIDRRRVIDSRAAYVTAVEVS